MRAPIARDIDPWLLGRASTSTGSSYLKWAAFRAWPQSLMTNSFQFDMQDDALFLLNKTELEQLVDGIAHHILILGADGSGLFANQSTLHYTGLELEEIQQEKDLCAKIFHPDDMKAFRLEFACGVSCEASWETEARMLDREGKYRWFLIRCNPLGNKRGQADRWCVTATDIEDRKRAEDELQKALDEIKQLKEQLSSKHSFRA
jgi:PAS domain S-box-containing protein